MTNIQQIVKEIKKLNKDAFILPVVKGRDEADFAVLREAGIFVAGESKAQEFIKHYSQYPDFKWHFIGQLQTNKVKYIVGKCELIHSLDRLSLANEIDRLSKKAGIVTNCLIQLNFGNQTHRGGLDISNLTENTLSSATENASEKTTDKVLDNVAGNTSETSDKKSNMISSNADNLSDSRLSVDNIVSSGIQVVEQFLSDISQCSNIKIKGLMAVMPLTDFEMLEIYYKALQSIFDYFKNQIITSEVNQVKSVCENNQSNPQNNAPQLEILSAGMSSDYKLALKYGSNLVRLGKILFE